jgi:hypothetical protein
LKRGPLSPPAGKIASVTEILARNVRHHPKGAVISNMSWNMSSAMLEVEHTV